MRKYLLLQLKRNGKVFPVVLGVALALLLCVGVILAGLFMGSKDDPQAARLKVAISGDTQNEMMQIGLSALKSFDDTRFAIELLEMPEEEAREKLRSGDVSAVVIFPPDFLRRALYGDVDQIHFITTPGGQTLVSILKEELTKAIADMALVCEKGSYALDLAVDTYTPGQASGKYVEELGIEYVQMILGRSRVYTLEELGISRGVSVAQYYICSMSVFLLMLFGLCFVTVRQRSDHGLFGLLAAKGMGYGKQTLCEYLAHFACLLGLLLTLIAAGMAVAAATGQLSAVAELAPRQLLWQLLPVVMMMAALQMMLFEFSDDPVSAVLLQLLACIGLCYASGCFYPVYALPLPVQAVARVLPTGLAREFLESAYSGRQAALQLLGIFAFTGVFFGITVLTRMGKLQRR